MLSQRGSRRQLICCLLFPVSLLVCCGKVKVSLLAAGMTSGQKVIDKRTGPTGMTNYERMRKNQISDHLFLTSITCL